MSCMWVETFVYIYLLLSHGLGFSWFRSLRKVQFLTRLCSRYSSWVGSDWNVFGAVNDQCGIFHQERSKREGWGFDRRKSISLLTNTRVRTKLTVRNVVPFYLPCVVGVGFTGNLHCSQNPVGTIYLRNHIALYGTPL